MSARDALERLDRANLPPCPVPPPMDETRHRLSEAEAPGVRVHAIDSAGLVLPEDEGHIVATGSHGALLGGKPETAIKIPVFAALYNDADFGMEDAGIARLPVLDARGIAGATVSAWSARIGDGQSTYRDGFVTAVNTRARAMRRRDRHFGERTGGAPGRGAREGTEMNAPVSNSARKLNGGQALAEMLKLSGVGPMFGMGGFQLLPFYEAMRALGLRHFLINDERCGAFASDAYARVTNRPGVCDATLGPGATNLVTALVESLNAGMPLISIVGDANRDHAWKNMTQEARQVEILKPAVKELIRVEGTKRIPELVRRAFAVATSGRPGPVVLDVPEDVCHGEHDFDAADFWVDEGTLKAQARRTRPDPEELERAAAIIAKAERPLLLVGGGIHISEGYDALLALAEGFGIPVAHTMSGKGAIACTHPLSAGLFGRYSRIANDLIAASDALIVVGCKLGEIPTRRFQLIPPGKPLIHIDILAEEIGRTTRTDVALVADARLALQDLAAALSDGGKARMKRQP